MDDKDKDEIKDDILKLTNLVQTGTDPINDLETARKLVESIEDGYRIKKRDEIIDDLLDGKN
tara:strand:- start:4874 stop:5059 length:186 start_codon:yes stop_codon:yes gene_type:complete